MYDKLKQTTESFIADSGLISDERKALLDELGIYIQSRLITDSNVKLLFICTRNSRRSQLAQVWAQTAAAYFGIHQINVFSGGTQKSALHPAVIDVLKETGFKVKLIKEGKNPHYRLKFCKKSDPVILFSKKYEHKKNPSEGFVAILTSNEAAEDCPVIRGADYRTTISFTDPRPYEGKEGQQKIYRELSQIIAREMLYVFSNVAR